MSFWNPFRSPLNNEIICSFKNVLKYFTFIEFILNLSKLLYSTFKNYYINVTNILNINSTCSLKTWKIKLWLHIS
jgi:hypothetical protein